MLKDLVTITVPRNELEALLHLADTRMQQIKDPTMPGYRQIRRSYDRVRDALDGTSTLQDRYQQEAAAAFTEVTPEDLERALASLLAAKLLLEGQP